MADYGAQLHTAPGPAFIVPNSTRPIPQRWPGITYPWMPWLPGWSGWSRPPGLGPRICLGSQCWPYAQMNLACANEMCRVACAKSWPLAEGAQVAVALYQNGYRRQARAVLDMYCGHYGMERVYRQIQNVYDPTQSGPPLEWI